MSPTDREVREAAWAIVRNARDLNATGHHRAVRWARGWLGLDEQAVTPVAESLADPSPRPDPRGHFEPTAQPQGEGALSDMRLGIRPYEGVTR